MARPPYQWMWNHHYLLGDLLASVAERRLLRRTWLQVDLCMVVDNSVHIQGNANALAATGGVLNAEVIRSYNNQVSQAALIDSELRAKLAESFGYLSSMSLRDEDKQQAAGQLRDMTIELAKEQPNKSSIKIWLAGIGETVGKAKPFVELGVLIAKFYGVSA